jgi:NIPSNAP
MMFINRITYKVKPGATDEVVKLSKAEIERTGSKAKVYTPYYGSIYVVVFDFEFESIESCGKFWDEWFASPEGDQFMKKFNTLVESGGSNELWNVE